MFFADKIGPVPKDTTATAFFHFVRTRLKGRSSVPEDEIKKLAASFLQINHVSFKPQDVLDELVRRGSIKKSGRNYQFQT